MTVQLEPVDSITITTLVDNTVDLLLMDQGPAKRPGLRRESYPQVAAPLLETAETVDMLRAEHGFSVMVTLTANGRARRVLFDAGITPDGLVENMRRLDLSPKDIEVIVLSHGHFDHTTGLDGIVRALGRANLPVMIHPEFWAQRRVVIPGQEPVELPSTSRQALLGAGFEVIEERQPSFLLDRALLVTGEVDRTTDFEKGMVIQQAYRDGDWVPDPLVLDDQALIAHVRGKGLVVLTGCGHAGIVNTLRYAKKLTGVDEIYAVLGGFHLSGILFEGIIPQTVEALAEVSPQVLVPAHCTGFKATAALAARFPGQLILNSLGTRFEL